MHCELLPHVTSKEVGCEIGTSEPKPWPDPLPPSRPPRHLDTSAPSPVPPAKKVGCKVGYDKGLRQATTDHHPLSAEPKPLLSLTYLPALEEIKLE